MFLTEKKMMRIRKLPSSSNSLSEDDMVYQSVLDTLEKNTMSYSSSSGSESISGNCYRKRKRLHELSWDEKIQRKKLRNRIAAQTSRDRKKAKMDNLEESVKELEDKNFNLACEVEELKLRNDELMQSQMELEKALSTRQCTCTCKRRAEELKKMPSGCKDVEQTCVEAVLPLDQPAELTNLPQQKGLRTALAQSVTATSWTLWKIMTLYLLSHKCWEISKDSHSLMTLRDWQKVCLKKLNSMTSAELWSLWQVKSQEVALKNSAVLLKWWGKHQKSWNPVEEPL